MPRRLLASVALCLLSTLPTFTQPAQRGMAVDDLYHLVSVGDPRFSPDGSRVAFVRTRVASDHRKRESSIWIVPSDGSGPAIRYTSGKEDRAPRWSPDGSRLGFLRKVNDTTRVYLLPLSGGEAFAVTTFDTSVSAFHWSPDGSELLLELATSSDTTAPRPSVTHKNPDYTWVTQTKYQSNTSGRLDSKRTHLYLFDLVTRRLAQVTSGDGWNDANPDWSADGEWIAFDADKSGQEYEGGDDDNLWLIGKDGENEELLTDHPHRDASPRWSPDGHQLAYLRQEEPFAQPDIFLYPTGTGEPKRLTGAFDRVPTGVEWSADGRFLFFTADDQGSHRAFRLAVESGAVEPLFEAGRSVRELRPSPDGGRLVFTLEDETSPPELWTSNAGGGDLKRLTDFNRSLLDSLVLQPLDPVEFQTREGVKLQGFVMRPHGMADGAKVAFVLNIKGGPGGMWGHQWFPEFQILAAAGYAVGFVNYRGSTGYGFDHQKAVRLDYGGVDFRDNMAFVDEVLRRYAWIDRDRLLVTGGSHGGFLTNWIVTQTDRFKAAVTQRSVSNWVSAAGTQEYTPLQMRREFGGSLWENYALYWERSPLRLADKVKTPTLILHSDGDTICPLGQAQEWFYALKAHDVPTELVIFHGENHSLSRTGKPVNQVERLKRMMAWFGRWGAP